MLSTLQYKPHPVKKTLKLSRFSFFGTWRASSRVLCTRDCEKKLEFSVDRGCQATRRLSRLFFFIALHPVQKDRMSINLRLAFRSLADFAVTVPVHISRARFLCPLFRFTPSYKSKDRTSNGKSAKSLTKKKFSLYPPEKSLSVFFICPVLKKIGLRTPRLMNCFFSVRSYLFPLEITHQK